MYFLLIFLSLRHVNVYFLIPIQVIVYFFNTNTGHCIFFIDNLKKTGFTGYVYDFSADYNAVTLDDIKDIHKYLMKKNDIV